MPKNSQNQSRREATCAAGAALLDQIFENNPYGILITDPQGRPVRWNRASVSLFGEDHPDPGEYSVFKDPLLLRAGLKRQLDRLRRGEPIAPLEVQYDPHELDPAFPSKLLHVRTTGFAIKDSGRVSHIVFMHQDVTARKEAEKAILRRESILQAIARSAQLFLESKRWQDHIGQVLRDIGQAVGAMRAYLFECTEKRRIALNSLWAAEHNAPTWPQDCAEHPVEAKPFRRWNQLLEKNQTVRGTIHTLPAPERRALKARGIGAVLQIPVFADGRWFGAIGFDDDKPREWTDGEVATLQTLAGLIGGAIQRQRVDVALQRTNDMLEARVAERTAELVSVNEELRKQVEQRKASEDRLRAVVDAMPDLVFIMDENGRIVDLLSREEDLLLAAGSEMRGMTLHQIMPTGTADKIVQTIRRTIQTGHIQHCEYLVESTRGKSWFEARSAPIPYTGSGARTVVWVARNDTDRKQVTLALEESEAKYRTLVDNLNIGVNRITVLPESRCIHANQACAEIFGYDSLEEFVALPVEQRYADPIERAKFISKVVRQGSFRNYEVKIRRKDGSEAIVSSSARAHYDEKGRVDYFDGIIEDVTERKEAEERLRLLSRVAEQTTEGIAVAGIDRRVIFVNNAYAAMHGMDPAEVIGQPVSVFHTPEQLADAIDNVEKRVRRAGRFRGIVWHVRKDGRIFPTLMTISALRWPNRRIAGFIATALDITEQIEAEEQRRLLARAVENAGEGIAILKPGGTFSYANTALARILGERRPTALLKMPWQKFFSPDGCQNNHEIMAELERTGRWAGRLVASCRSGKTTPVAVTLARIGPGEHEKLIVADIRDQSAEEAHLAQVRRLTLAAAQGLEDERARLSRELHDELGQTLTAINLNLAWLKSRSEPWGRSAQERLDEATQFVNHMLDSVRSLSTSLRPPILDNRGLLDAIRSYAGDFARRAGISCRVTAGPTDIEVHDPLATTMFRIFQEAITNVARHSRATKCGIFLKTAGSIIELKVRDNGVGAVPKRLEGVESLGIAGMRERAARVGGFLRVENRPEGGVCVTARLPWQQQQKRNDE